MIIIFIEISHNLYDYYRFKIPRKGFVTSYRIEAKILLISYWDVLYNE